MQRFLGPFEPNGAVSSAEEHLVHTEGAAGSIPAPPTKSTTLFWARVQKGAADDCWPWQGATMKNGYGRVKRRGKAELAHREAFRLTKGEIPVIKRPYATLIVLHRCDNRACCNPDHLYLGTYMQNARDMVDRGRTQWDAKRG